MASKNIEFSKVVPNSFLSVATSENVATQLDKIAIKNTDSILFEFSWTLAIGFLKILSTLKEVKNKNLNEFVKKKEDNIKKMMIRS